MPVGIDKHFIAANEMFGLEDVLFNYATNAGLHPKKVPTIARRAVYSADDNWRPEDAETVVAESTTILAIHVHDLLKALPTHILDQ